VFQSGRYMQQVFRGMLRLLPKDVVPKRILVIGLGAGGCVPVIQKWFPKVHLVTMEYDEVMIALAKKTYLKDMDLGGVEILVGDMRETLPRMEMDFDLILVDVFCGKHVAPALVEENVLRELSRVLSWQGYLLVNLFREADSLSSRIETYFSQEKKQRVNYNDVCLYRHYGMGVMGDGVPKGFQDREQSRTYLTAQYAKTASRAVVEHDGLLGVQTPLGPIVLESYIQEPEPDLTPTKQIRVVSWQPYKGKVFSGWWRFPSLLTIHYKRGVAILNQETYWKDWSSHAKRHREKFLGDDRYEIVEVDLETFSHAYHETKFLDPITRRMFIKVLRYHLDRHPEDVHLCVVRQVADGRLVAGLATIDYADISQSDHVIAFIHPDVQKTSVGVGLIDDWYGRCLQNKLTFLQFGLLHRPGDPISWKGYTQFKRQFHLFEIQYPQPVWRIIWPKTSVL